MITALAQSVLVELLSFLRTNTSFFSLSAEERQHILPENLKKSKSLSTYMMEVSEEDFLTDIEDFTTILTHKVQSKSLKKNSYLEAFIMFLMNDFAQMLDMKVADQNITNLQINEILSLYSTQEITQQVQSFISSFTAIPYIVVQSPLELSAHMKQEIRTSLLQKHTYAFPTFTLNKGLIGGIRILVDGVTTDQSWYGRVMNLSHLLYQRT